MNTDKKLSVLIGLWILDKLIILLMLIFMSCQPFEYTCSNNEAYNWECECLGTLKEELEEPPEWGNQDATWYFCCNQEQDSCWHRVLED